MRTIILSRQFKCAVRNTLVYIRYSNGSRWKVGRPVAVSCFSADELSTSNGISCRYPNASRVPQLFCKKINDILNKPQNYPIRQYSGRRLRIPTVQSRSTDTDSIYNDDNVHYVNVRAAGMTFNIGYVDSHFDEPYDPECPIILGLHGSPGTHRDLLPLLEPLTKKGYRVIGLNFPGFTYNQGATTQDVFSFLHVPDAKANFVLKFLKVLKIPSVDMIIGHSAGCYTVPILAVKRKICKSICYICPAPHFKQRIMDLNGVVQFMASMVSNPFLRPLLYVPTWVMKNALGFRQFTVKEMFVTALTVAFLDFHDVISNAASLDAVNFPRIMVYSLKDKLIRPRFAKQLADVLGLTDEHFTVYDAEDNKISEATSIEISRGILFTNGTHYPQLKYRHATIIVECIDDMLKSLRHGS